MLTALASEKNATQARAAELETKLARAVDDRRRRTQMSREAGRVAAERLNAAKRRALAAEAKLEVAARRLTVSERRLRQAEKTGAAAAAAAVAAAASTPRMEALVRVEDCSRAGTLSGATAASEISTTTNLADVDTSTAEHAMIQAASDVKTGNVMPAEGDSATGNVGETAAAAVVSVVGSSSSRAETETNTSRMAAGYPTATAASATVAPILSTDKLVDKQHADELERKLWEARQVLESCRTDVVAATKSSNVRAQPAEALKTDSAATPAVPFDGAVAAVAQDAPMFRRSSTAGAARVVKHEKRARYECERDQSQVKGNLGTLYR